MKFADKHFSVQFAKLYRFSMSAKGPGGGSWPGAGATPVSRGVQSAIEESSAVAATKL